MNSSNRNKPKRLPGQSDQDMIRVLELEIAVFIGVVSFFALFIFYEWLVWLMHTPPQPVVWTCIGAIAIGFSLYSIRKLILKKRDWEQGRQGEIEVGHYLEELRPIGCVVFHDIQCENNGKQFNIDHVIVSRWGIFAVETKKPRRKTKGNQIHFDGTDKITLFGRCSNKPVSEAIYHAETLSLKLLPKNKYQRPYPVLPVLVYPGWSVIGQLINKHIWVLNPKMLQYEIPKLQETLTQEECNAIEQVLDLINR